MLQSFAYMVTLPFRDVVANVIGEQTNFDNRKTYISRMQRNLKALEAQ